MASSSNNDIPQMDEENAQNEEAAKIAQFREFCALEDDNIARTCLERCEWNVEIAVQEYLNEREGRPSLLSQEGMENQENQQQEAGIRRRHVPQPPPPLQMSYSGLVRRGGVHRVGLLSPQHVGWARWLYGFVLLPFRFVTTICYDLFDFIWSILFRRRPAAVTDPVGDVRRFIQQYEEKYGNIHPEFFVGSYSSALELAKKELRFLLVYIHSPSHQDTNIFCTQVLADPNLVQFINQNTIFWAASLRSAEGARVSTALRESTYPFLALICLRDTRMSMVLRQEGYCSAEDMMNYLGAAIQENQTFLTLARQERDQRQMDQLIRGQQEEAFKESLKKDQEREQRLLEEKRAKELEEQYRQAAIEKAQRLKEEFEELKEEIRSHISSDEDLGSGEDVVRVRVQFPDGTRIERRFLTSDSLEELFKVVLISESCPENFSVVTNYPRTELRCRPQWAERFFLKDDEEHSSSAEEKRIIPSFAEAKLTNAVTVLVQDNDA